MNIVNKENEIFELVTKMYSEFSKKFESIDNRFESMDSRFESIESELKSIKKTVLNIKQDHGNKLEALFDGYKQNSEKLDRIEKEVTKHEEFIMKRVK